MTQLASGLPAPSSAEFPLQSSGLGGSLEQKNGVTSEGTSGSSWTRASQARWRRGLLRSGISLDSQRTSQDPPEVSELRGVCGSTCGQLGPAAQVRCDLCGVGVSGHALSLP